MERGSIITDRAITLTLPWSALMAIDKKHFETRSRRTRFRGWVAIHAAKAFPEECRRFMYLPPFTGALCVGGFNSIAHLDALRGKVIAVVEMLDCISTSDFDHGDFPLTELERAFGNYGPGRFAYLTRNVRRLREPFGARGFQSIPWRLPMPITEDMLLC